MPVRFSRVTRFRSSVRRWITLNRGSTSTATARIIRLMSSTAVAVVSIHCHCLPTIFMMPHTIITGVLVMICSPMATSICTWEISLVLRVIRLATEKRPSSSL